MTKPFFSIIIPTLNEEKNLPVLLNCIKKQSFGSYEVIVVDAKSDDNTPQIVKEYKPQFANFKNLTSPIRSLSLQRNIGAQRARGKYLFFVDADSRIPKIFLAKIYEKLQSGKIHLLTTWLDGDSRKFIYRLTMKVNNAIIEFFNLIGKPFACGADLFISRKVFHKIKGFRTDLTMSEDHDLVMRAYLQGYKLYILQSPRLVFSLRRLRHEGFIKVLLKYFIAETYFIIKGPVTRKLYNYHMGGQAHRQRVKQ